jgi:acyl-CoA thioesterase-1
MRNVQQGLALMAAMLALASVAARAEEAPQTPKPVQAAAHPVNIVALGDSLTAGYGLKPGEGFVPSLEKALKAKGYNVTIANAGVSGDTASGGLERLDWSVPDGTNAVILELGANDMLRGIAPVTTRKALDTILSSLKQRNIPVLITGMRAAPNLGPDYQASFDAIYPDLARKYGAILYPFFLEGVAADRALNQPDGIHPGPKGVDIIVSRILPSVEQLIAKAHQGG